MAAAVFTETWFDGMFWGMFGALTAPGLLSGDFGSIAGLNSSNTGFLDNKVLDAADGIGNRSELAGSRNKRIDIAARKYYTIPYKSCKKKFSKERG